MAKQKEKPLSMDDPALENRIREALAKAEWNRSTATTPKARERNAALCRQYQRELDFFLERKARKSANAAG